jgi:hypothetical protein
MNRLNLNLEKLLSGTQIKSLREARHALNRKSFTKFNYLFSKYFLVVN